MNAVQLFSVAPICCSSGFICVEVREGQCMLCGFKIREIKVVGKYDCFRTFPLSLRMTDMFVLISFAYSLCGIWAGQSINCG